ncbi:MAG TPA: cupin domain-containing protein [Polyangia bacterium]|nr:cupin domain-containing protein [Polyangia bacterium]
MANPVSVSRFEIKSHDAPDELRSPNKTRVEVVGLEGYTLGRISLEPGWRWSECIKPVVKTDWCQVSHVGHCLSGSIVVKMKDGTEKTISSGQSYTIPPGHDAWTASNEKFVGLEVLSADVFAKPA